MIEHLDIVDNHDKTITSNIESFLLDLNSKWGKGNVFEGDLFLKKLPH